MSSQKFIGRNRAPRVQIEYDVELYGAEKKVQLPFVMGVMSDLSGNAGKPQPPVAERKFLEIAADTLDDRMKAMGPAVKMQVPNKLTGEGNLSVQLSFEKLDDFNPAAIARQVPALRQLLEARMQLANLITYMDGKTGAEELISKILNDKNVLQSLASTPKPAEEAASSEENKE
jgi:type VI secretion system protein ImpB